MSAVDDNGSFDTTVIREMDLISGYRRLWDSINGKPRKYKTDMGITITAPAVLWSSNPWVWVYRFNLSPKLTGEQEGG